MVRRYYRARQDVHIQGHLEEQVKLTTELRNGYDAAKALRPVCGRVEIIVRKRKKTPQDAHLRAELQAEVALRVRAHVPRIAHTAATRIAFYWRRYAAIEAEQRLRRRPEDEPRRNCDTGRRRYDRMSASSRSSFCFCSSAAPWLHAPRRGLPRHGLRISSGTARRRTVASRRLA